MHAAAVGAGERYIVSERKLEDAFRNRPVTKESLRIMLKEVEESRVALRYIPSLHIFQDAGDPDQGADRTLQ
jgi:hypothetical protein